MVRAPVVHKLCCFNTLRKIKETFKVLRNTEQTEPLPPWVSSYKIKLELQAVRTGAKPPERLGLHTLQSPRKLAPKDDGLGAKVRTQANVWAMVFAVMGSALEVQKADCVLIWICCTKPRPLWPVMTTFKVWPQDWPYIIPTKFRKMCEFFDQAKIFW